MYKRQAKIQIADSLDAANKKELKKIEQPASIVVKTDTVPPPAQDINKKIFIPDVYKRQIPTFFTHSKS